MIKTSFSNDYVQSGNDKSSQFTCVWRMLHLLLIAKSRRIPHLCSIINQLNLDRLKKKSKVRYEPTTSTQNAAPKTIRPFFLCFRSHKFKHKFKKCPKSESEPPGAVSQRVEPANPGGFNPPVGHPTRWLQPMVNPLDSPKNGTLVLTLSSSL